ncbi:bck1-like resistance to osmotic shock [Cladophialophora chaetospira]|uniref:BRO domain-containing protein 1 n=1 Tax=Cladophialophora chaetospira TaxID=386627 RepID=A0AA38X9N6_9EURO|nr:bck1-like resistance to osmotic shock [Cladophialophora chaetospira]
MVQAPMISCPLKTTSEVSWVEPLSQYIRTSYGDDPSKYAEEIGTLNRLRQDMRGAGADSASGRDLLYRYYGQLELLDLRFPIDEAHIKISFQWFDAFTRSATSQYSLAFEKASVIFNIAAVLSCHAAAQNRSEDKDLKTAYHSFQASAGMFTYINENFLHAPSTDLNRDTVKTVISIVLGQAQEVFLEKQVRDGKKPALLAKLAAQAAFLYGQAKEGLESDHARGVFESVWLKFIQIKALHLSSLAEYYQALGEDETNQQGSAIARLQLAEKSSKQANSLAKSFPSTPSSASQLGSDTASTLQSITRRQMENVQEKLTSLVKDNDYIYHQTVPAEASLSPVTKVPAAKAIPLSELYQGQDIQRIIGPDIFQKIVPISVTESASMYDEEKAKLIRSEAEKVEQANGEMAASLDYLKLPNSLNVLKGGLEQEMGTDREFESWCQELTNHQSFSTAFEQLQRDKQAVLDSLAKSTKQLDMEESVCEKMRSKYGPDWTQQPSSRLTSTLRADVKSYRDTVDEAGNSDAQLFSTARQYEGDFEEMRNAGEQGEADILYQQALIKAGSASKGRSKSGGEGSLLDEDYGEGGFSVADQIAKVEDLLRKLNLVKRERMQVLKDLKEKVHTDDISNVLILNKKAIANQENQLFQAELEKFRSHQNRLISTVHKQASLLKELTKTYGDLLQDKRVRSDQQRYDAMQKSKSSVMNKYRRVFNAHEDLIQGLMRAQGFYTEMKESVDSLEKNVESFVSNRRAEGAQLLHSIEQTKNSSADGQAAAEQKRMQELMNRLSMEPKPISPSHTEPPALPPLPPINASRSPAPVSPSYPTTNPDPRFTIPPRHSPAPVVPNGYSTQLQPPSQPTNPSPIEGQHVFAQGAATPLSSAYNPMAYPQRSAVTSPNQQQQPGPHTFSPVTSPPPGSMNAYFPQAQQHHPLTFTSPSHQYPQYGFPSHPPTGAPPGAGAYQSPSPHPQMPQSQPSYHQHQHQPYQPSPSPYNMPQNYVPPPPPPGPPGGGSTTQYPPNAPGGWASGPGGYANYTQRYPQAQQGQGHPQHPLGQPQSGGAQEGDPWAGLSAWK